MYSGACSVPQGRNAFPQVARVQRGDFMAPALLPRFFLACGCAACIVHVCVNLRDDSLRANATGRNEGTSPSISAGIAHKERGKPAAISLQDETKHALKQSDAIAIPGDLERSAFATLYVTHHGNLTQKRQAAADWGKTPRLLIPKCRFRHSRVANRFTKSALLFSLGKSAPPGTACWRPRAIEWDWFPSAAVRSPLPHLIFIVRTSAS